MEVEGECGSLVKGLCRAWTQKDVQLHIGTAGEKSKVKGRAQGDRQEMGK